MAIVNLDKVLSGANGNLESIVAYDSGANLVKDYANGLFVDVDVLLPDSAGKWTGRKGEVKKGVISTDGTKDTVMLHAPELQYDERSPLRNFKNEEGKVVRGYRLQRGDIITVTDQAITVGSHGDLAVGNTLTVKNGRLAKEDSPKAGQLTLKVIEDAGNTLDTVEKAWTLQVQ